MKKETLKSIYSGIFLLSLILATISIQFNAPYLNNKWISFIISMVILILSLMGYKGISK